MQGHTRVRVLHQVLHHIISVFLFVHKYNDSTFFLVLPKNLQQLEELLIILQNGL